MINAVLRYAVRYFKKLDKFLLALCVTASAFSVYMLYTIVQNGINPAYVNASTWKTQLYAAAGGVFFALILAGISYRFLSKIWFTYSALALILSLLLFTPLGVRTAGASDLNWLNLGFIQIQPSEFLKVAFIMTFSTHLYKVGDKMNHPLHMLALCVHGMIPVGIVFVQDDWGTTMIIALMFVTMLFTAGLSWKYIVPGIISVPVLGFVFWNFLAKDYHKLRIQVIFDKAVQEQEIQGLYHQQSRSLIALGSGGLTGQGLTDGEYTSIFAIHNDFIFSYIGMTLGFVGCAIVLLFLLTVFFKLLATASAARELLGKSICAGTFAMVFFHSVINIGMAIAVTPVVGVPLPFISAGGSSTLALYCAIGLTLSVWARREKEYHMFYEEKD